MPTDRVALVQGGGMWMEGLAWGLAKGQALVTRESSTAPEGPEPEKVLTRAKLHVAAMDLDKAVAELSALSGRPAEVPWRVAFKLTSGRSECLPRGPACCV